MGLEVFNPFAGLLGEKQQQDSWRWGTVVATDPLRVQLDGDTTPLITPPDTLTPVLTGDRVRVHVHNRRATIIGRDVDVAPPPSPGPVVTDLVLQNGWQAFGSGYQYPEYEVFPDGRVQLHGRITPGTKTNGTVITTVPATLAPIRRRVFVVGAGGLGAGRLDLTPTGEILLVYLGSMAELGNISWLTLETVSW